MISTSYLIFCLLAGVAVAISLTLLFLAVWGIVTHRVGIALWIGGEALDENIRTERQGVMATAYTKGYMVGKTENSDGYTRGWPDIRENGQIVGYVRPDHMWIIEKLNKMSEFRPVDEAALDDTIERQRHDNVPLPRRPRVLE